MAAAARLVGLALTLSLIFIPSTAAQCTALVRIPRTYQNNGQYQAEIDLVLVNTGSSYSAGGQSLYVSNPNYLQLISTSGWSGSGSGGSVSGTVQLGGGLANGGSVSVNMVVAGSSPQNFFPRSVSFGGRSCHIQQTR
ncbi:hypothetical protein CVIRNUC_006896 [Coccomyxa viridis]|uniref:Uncharacterized protein n=1 Tax=Coccomyxa viridis TaxID=1274662 RepID=A0AAV1IAI8_9CHLO|nr:hypothetical protein CVIRNUC_006896 [Coccomyxa viridis]